MSVSPVNLYVFIFLAAFSLSFSSCMCYRICEEIADSSPRSGAGLPLDENLFFNSFFDLFLVSYTPSLPDVSCSAVKPGVSGLIVLFYSA